MHKAVRLFTERVGLDELLYTPLSWHLVASGGMSGIKYLYETRMTAFKNHCVLYVFSMEFGNVGCPTCASSVRLGPTPLEKRPIINT